MLSRILGFGFKLKRFGSVRLDPEHSGSIRFVQDFEFKSKSEITAGDAGLG